MGEKKSARWNSPRSSQRALFSKPPCFCRVRLISPRRSVRSVSACLVGLAFRSGLSTLGTTKECLKIRRTEALLGAYSGQVGSKTAISPKIAPFIQKPELFRRRNHQPLFSISIKPASDPAPAAQRALKQSTRQPTDHGSLPSRRFLLSLFQIRIQRHQQVLRTGHLSRESLSLGDHFSGQVTGA